MCFSSVRGKAGVDTSTGSPQSPQHSTRVCTRELHASREDKAQRRSVGCPDLQLELSLSFTSTISSVSLSKVMNFSHHHFFELFLSQLLALLCCISF